MPESKQPCRYGLRRSIILRKRQDFDLVRRSGKRINSHFLGCNYFLKTDFSVDKYGKRSVAFIIPKACGNAVKRNKIRRRMREIYRHLQHDLPESLWSVWIARRASADATFVDLRNEMILIYKKAGMLES
ncbi:MAG: ribonuclease P protein component [Verrucomicrobiota bacterium]